MAEKFNFRFNDPKEAYIAAELVIENLRSGAQGALDLSNYGLQTLPSKLFGLPNLTELDLSNNRLCDLSESIGDLQSLTLLNLSRNQLSELPESIGELERLARLNLSSNQLSELPDSIGELESLTELNLSSNQLSELPDSIGELESLTELYLSSNQLSELPDSIGELESLTVLNLSSNQLSELPDSIGELESLTELYLSSNQLSELPDSIGELESLTELDLLGNQLSELPDSIGELESLTVLDLSGNQLSELPESIGELERLARLNLSSNQLIELPDSIVELESLTGFYLHGNRLIGIPGEILGPLVEEIYTIENRSLPEEQRMKPQEPGKIQRYISGIQGGKARRLNEAKLLVVGPGGAGKTSVIEQLIEHRYTPDTKISTHGVVVQKWENECSAGGEDIRVNVWDFGGQELQHSTHEFFLTARAVYVLVFNPREDQSAQAVLYYWLDLIQMIAPGAPVIVVLSKQDEYHGHLNDAQELKRKYPIVDYVQVSCLESSDHFCGFQKLRELIASEIGKLEHVANRLPPSWIAVKNQLEEANDDFWAYARYRELCEEKEVIELEDQQLLARFLHDLGTMLNYADRIPLEDTNILNPRWVTEGVYALILSEELQKAAGILDDALVKRLDELLERLLRKEKRLTENEPYDTRYPPQAGRFVLEMMKQFSLCHPLMTTAEHPKNRYLVPNALPPAEPELDEIPGDALRFELHYPRILPSSVIGRFMVHMELEPDSGQLWRQGVSHQLGENPYRVTMHDQEKRIKIAVWGKEDGRVATLEQIRRSLNLANRIRKGLEVEEWVPLPDDPETGVLYSFLQQLDDKNIESQHVQNSKGELVEIVPRVMLGRMGEDREMRFIMRKFTQDEFVAQIEEHLPDLVKGIKERASYRDKIRFALDHRDRNRTHSAVLRDLRGESLVSLFGKEVREDGMRTRETLKAVVSDEAEATRKHVTRERESLLADLGGEFAEIASGVAQLEEQMVASFSAVEDQIELGFLKTCAAVDRRYQMVADMFNDLAAEGPRLVRVNQLPNQFWKITKVRFQVQLHCEHSGLSVPAIERILTPANRTTLGIYKIEATSAWFNNAAPVLCMLSKLIHLIVTGTANLSTGAKGIQDDTQLLVALAGNPQASSVAPDRAALERKLMSYGPVLRKVQGFLEAADAKSSDGFGGLHRGIVNVGNDEGKFRWVHSLYKDVTDPESGEKLYRF